MAKIMDLILPILSILVDIVPLFWALLEVKVGIDYRWRLHTI